MVARPLIKRYLPLLMRLFILHSSENDGTVQCPHCSVHFRISHDIIVRSLRGETVKCERCGEHLNWFQVVFNGILLNFMAVDAFVPIGARTTTFRLPVEQGKTVVVKFADYGLPPHARIFHINYTPTPPDAQGVLMPLEMHGNGATAHRFRGEEVVIYPAGLGNVIPQSHDVTVSVTWLPASVNDAGWLSLVNAFEAYVAGKYENCVVPANVAVESGLSRFMNRYLAEHGVSKARVDDFLVAAATYSHQLNVLLPLITSLAKLTPLSDSIRGSLNRLRDLRNGIAHHGQTKKPLTKEVAAEVLTAALFGLRYVQLLRMESGLLDDA